MFGLSKLKAIIYSLLAGAALLFGFSYKKRGSKIEEQEKELNAKNEELKVQDIVHESDISKKDLDQDLKVVEAKIVEEQFEAKNETQEKVHTTADEEEYEIKVR